MANYTTYQERFEAWQSRDSGAIGKFVLAVRTTRIYCRIGCPARSPKQENILFFDTPQDAERAGYRACLRCKPKEALGGVVNQLKQLIQSEPSITLAELGKAVALSPFHLQRVFKQATGVSPKQYASALRLNSLKHRLRAGDSVTDALYDSGYTSSSQVPLGMSPKVYRRKGAGLHIHYAFIACTIGLLIVGATPKGICSILVGQTHQELETLLREEFSGATFEEGVAQDWLEGVLAHLVHQNPSLPLDLQGTAFQIRVWEALRQIPAGQTRTYSQLAQALGNPKAVRAVASACGANPVSLVVPCHRVIGANGSLTGYRWGTQRKKQLLEQEALQHFSP
jgi:AraC family transcriptional regulator, regulatory protein of adaptative response / methylated-DNA-[protein]-cysteine methyltransferase